MLEPTPPDTLAEFTERIEAAGIRCGGVSTADADGSTFVCGDDLDVSATYYHRRLTGVHYSGSYISLKALRSERAFLSGDRFAVEGPYETLVRVQRELGGDLQRLSGGQ
ncbi:MAG: hypothetical protein AVDCRST_MAG16-2074 [uncultured Frankineae bacterium]|uniref:Uncharacterized protein n=1 Tax=uncultured Frankineae bacterium TaxID=437475 RepID=A0A6J4M503_9ACTN|nr:MAG: hypothetical protein AVDCRST_MAG16-2074 [uncultured Frankineae bacterium]